MKTLDGVVLLSLKIQPLLQNSQSHEEVVRGAFNVARQTANLWKEIPSEFPVLPFTDNVKEGQQAIFLHLLTAKNIDKGELIAIPKKHQNELKEFISGFAEKSLELARSLGSTS